MSYDRIQKLERRIADLEAKLEGASEERGGISRRSVLGAGAAAVVGTSLAGASSEPATAQTASTHLGAPVIDPGVSDVGAELQSLIDAATANDVIIAPFQRFDQSTTVQVTKDIDILAPGGIPSNSGSSPLPSFDTGSNDIPHFESAGGSLRLFNISLRSDPGGSAPIIRSNRWVTVECHAINPGGYAIDLETSAGDNVNKSHISIVGKGGDGAVRVRDPGDTYDTNAGSAFVYDWDGFDEYVSDIEGRGWDIDVRHAVLNGAGGSGLIALRRTGNSASFNWAESGHGVDIFKSGQMVTAGMNAEGYQSIRKPTGANNILEQDVPSGGLSAYTVRRQMVGSKVYKTDNQTIDADGGIYPVTWQGHASNDLNQFDLSSGTFTAASAGEFEVSAQLKFIHLDPGDNPQAILYKNNSRENEGASAGRQSLVGDAVISTSVDCEKGDELDIRARFDSDSDTGTIYGAPRATYAEFERI